MFVHVRVSSCKFTCVLGPRAGGDGVRIIVHKAECGKIEMGNHPAPAAGELFPGSCAEVSVRGGCPLSWSPGASQGSASITSTTWEVLNSVLEHCKQTFDVCDYQHESWRWPRRLAFHIPDSSCHQQGHHQSGSAAMQEEGHQGKYSYAFVSLLFWAAACFAPTQSQL